MTIEPSLAELIDQRDALSRRIRDVENRERDQKSDAFAAALNVRMADVQLSSGPGVPCFMMLAPFLAWVRRQRPVMRLYEWNGQVQLTNEGVSGYHAGGTTIDAVKRREEMLSRQEQVASP